MDEEEVVIRREGTVGHLSLNRPRALHALTHGMCRAMIDALAQWAADDAITAVVVDHSEGRGFCAGGDIAVLREAVVGGNGAAGREFFIAEYQLNHAMFTFAKPMVTFMDGITMGGGVGISLPASFRVVTENTRFAMPETGIGLFPDVGGSLYLSRLSGRIGQFLALTGARFDAGECMWAGLGTHFLAASDLADAKQRIFAHPDRMAGILAGLSASPPPARISGNASLVAHHFASDEFDEIVASLESDDSGWAAKELATIRSKSPFSCKVALRQLALGAGMDDFAEIMRMEYRLVSRMISRPDFAEGVRAVITDKTGDPAWQPAIPDDVTPEMLDAVFAPLPADEEWAPHGG